jgi:hypothetical protein
VAFVISLSTVRCNDFTCAGSFTKRNVAFHSAGPYIENQLGEASIKQPALSQADYITTEEANQLKALFIKY